ncbi:PRC-barrel domain-containing protein [Azospirillum sp. sgz301742]
MRTDLIAAAAALALISGASGSAAAQNAAQGSVSSPAVGETSPSLGVVHLEDFMEKNVIGANGQPVGTVEDVLLGPDGQPLRLIVSTGPGNKDVSIDLSRVEVRSDSDALFVADLTRQDIDAMPAFQDDGSMTSLNAGRPPAQDGEGAGK